MPLAIPIIMGAAALTKMGIGMAQAHSAKKKLEELGKIPRPKYETGESIYNRANAIATGLTPEERARANQQFAQLNNTRYQLGIQKNPTVAGAVQAGVNYGNPAQALGLAAQDAQVRRQNLNQLVSLFGGQSNRQAATDISYRNQTEMALGAAHSRGVENVSKGIDGVSNAAAFAYGGWGGGGAAGTAAKPYGQISATPFNQNNVPSSTALPPPTKTPTDWSNPYGAPRDNSTYSLIDPTRQVPYRNATNPVNMYGIPYNPYYAPAP